MTRYIRTAATLCVGFFALAVTAQSCTGDLGGPSLTAPCEGELAAECGKTCGSDADCVSGLYCDLSGQCFADCVQGANHCDAGLSCADNGRCQDPNGGDGGGFDLTGAGGATSGGGFDSCGAVDINFEADIPTVVLLIDQSGSMDADFNGQGQRWDVVYDALMDPADGVVTQLQDIVRFGLALYTWRSGTCPAVIAVSPPALGNHTPIDLVYAPEGPEANTPTGDSIDAIVPELAAFAEPGPKLIILATDGDPDRCEDPDGHDQAAMDEATDAAQSAYAQGIETVIIAVGDQVSEQHQQDMANAGKGMVVPADPSCLSNPDPMICAPRYEPTSKQALIDALSDIILGQRTCVFTLDGSVIPGRECDGTVTLNGTIIPCNDADGWKLNSPTEIEFTGAACDTILSDPDVNVTAQFPCDSISNPPS